MKKHIVLIMNIILVVLLLGAVGFTIYNVMSRQNEAKPASSEHVGAQLPSGEEETELPSVDPSKHYKIGIVQHYNNNDSNDCYAGFISEMNERGMIGNVDIVYIIEEDEDRCTAEIQRLINEKCDLLCTIGPYASSVAASLTTDIPIVFAGIADPERAGLISSSENPGGNITGVSSYTPVFEQIDLIKVLLPQVKKVATVYSSTDEYAVTQAIIAAKEAEEQGMKMEKYPITKPAEIEDALADIRKSGVQSIYLPVDTFIFKHMSTIMEFTDKNKIPVFVGNEKMLRAGAFATSKINYTSIGRKAAGQSYDILFGKKDPASLSVIYKYDCYNLVNQAAAEKLGVRLNECMRDQVQVKDYTAE